jgi:hypothetical protein
MSKSFQEYLRLQGTVNKNNNETTGNNAASSNSSGGNYADLLRTEMDCFRPEFAGRCRGKFAYFKYPDTKRLCFSGSTISGAIVVAIDDINQNPALLPDYRLSYLFDNTCGNNRQGTDFCIQKFNLIVF